MCSSLVMEIKWKSSLAYWNMTKDQVSFFTLMHEDGIQIVLLLCMFVPSVIMFTSVGYCFPPFPSCFFSVLFG